MTGFQNSLTTTIDLALIMTHLPNYEMQPPRLLVQSFFIINNILDMKFKA